MTLANTRAADFKGRAMEGKWRQQVHITELAGPVERAVTVLYKAGRAQKKRPRRALFTNVAQPRPAMPGPARPRPLSTESSREPRKAPCCRLQLLPCPATPCHAPPRPASLGLTPKDAQYNQATAASIRLRLSAGITSASNRPCLGLQSPSPTSLPASAAISATSPMFSTSGSY